MRGPGAGGGLARCLPLLFAAEKLGALDLSRTAVTDGCCDHLLAIKSLQGVSVSEASVTTVGLGKLAVLPRLQRIVILGVEVGDKERDGLLDRLPGRVTVLSAYGEWRGRAKK